MSDAPRPTIVDIIDGALVSRGPAAPARELQAAVAAAFEDAPDLDPAEDLTPPPAPPVLPNVDPDVVRDCSGQEENDTGNGYRLRQHFGRELLNVREVGWHTYDGRVWVREGGDEAILKYAQDTAKLIHAEADALELYPFEVKILDAARPLRGRDDLTDDEKEAVDKADRTKKELGKRRAGRRKFAQQSGNDSRISAMIRQASPHKTVGPKRLDADHMLFNCENGTLQFCEIEDVDHAGEGWPVTTLDVVRLAHERDHLITKVAPVSYDPAATCPKWLEFMERFQPDPSIRRFLQAFHGIALTGMNGHQSFIYSYGKGANGKSTFMEALGELFGPYSDTLNAESLSGAGQRRGDQATPDFADLPGVRYLRVAELPRGEPLKEALIKALTGGDKLKVRHLNKGFFDLFPIFKAGMSGNDLPQIGGLDDGIWRRVKLVPWSVQIPDAERRPMAEILAGFRAERAGILNWLIEGLRIYLSEGLVTPKIVEEATKEYRDDMDPIGAFVADCLEPCAGHFEECGKVYEAFAAWCEVNSIRPWKQNMFGRAMSQKGIVREKTRIRRYLNVKLHDVPEVAPQGRERAPKDD